MEYNHIIEGIFIDRPNRFIAHVEVDGKIETVHVKNTGRCAEILTPGSRVFLEQGSNPQRKTAYDLVAAMKQDRLINIDSQAPNKVAMEWIYQGGFFKNPVNVKPEKVFGDSRIDFYLEDGDKKILLEVKGVTLEKDNVVSFPDAPSERAVKHLRELMKAASMGYEAYVLLVVQMKGVKYFIPEKDRHEEFARVLQEAAQNGVHVLAYDCLVSKDSLKMDEPVAVFMSPGEYLTREEKIAEPLLTWYRANRRILPWREDPTPFHVWLSEIMLQQTRVEAVKPYYARFLEKIPGIEELAKATEETILKLWEGLGYYSRIRNMQKAARTIMEEYGGEMPDRFEELKKLQGIGDYTAGAIASIAFQKPVGAVDGNVLRVLSRYHLDSAFISEDTTKKKVFAELGRIIPVDAPGEFNQAMMDLGAMICTPGGTPHCEQCPLQKECLAHLQGVELQYPKKAQKKQRTIQKLTVLVVKDQGKIALHKRDNKGLLAGLYEFPNRNGHLSEEEVLKELKDMNISALQIQRLADSVHIFTHKEWHMIAYMIRVDELSERSIQGEAGHWEYVDFQDVQEKYPIPSAFAAYRPYISKKD